MILKFYDYDGNLIDEETWRHLFHARPSGLVRWRAALTQVEEFEVSTVWIGHDPLEGLAHEEPLIFETLIRGPGTSLQERSPSADEAMEVHQKWLDRLHDPDVRNALAQLATLDDE